MLRAASTLLRLRHLPPPSCLTGGVRLSSSSPFSPHLINGYPHYYHYNTKDSEAIKLFESWCRKYHKTYSSLSLKFIRFSIFKEKLKNSTCEIDLHVYADLTSEEWKQMNLAKPPGGRLCSSVVETRDPDPNGGNFHSEAEAMELFEIWCEEYGKTYSSKEEKMHRFGVFKERLEWCTRENQKHANTKFRCFGTNGYADLTSEEMNELFGFGRRRPLRSVLPVRARAALGASSQSYFELS